MNDVLEAVTVVIVGVLLGTAEMELLSMTTDVENVGKAWLLDSDADADAMAAEEL